MNELPPPDPTLHSPTLEEAKRCVKFATRIGFKASVLDLGEFGPKEKRYRAYGIRIEVDKPTEKLPFVQLKSINSWRNWVDSKLYYVKPLDPMWWDKFPPSFAEHKEKEIHKWIKEYKEVD